MRSDIGDLYAIVVELDQLTKTLMGPRQPVFRRGSSKPRCRLPDVYGLIRLAVLPMQGQLHEQHPVGYSIGSNSGPVLCFSKFVDVDANGKPSCTHGMQAGCPLVLSSLGGPIQ